MKTVNVKLRIEEDLHETLKELAQASERTVAGEMRLALRNHVALVASVKRGPVTIVGTDGVALEAGGTA